MSSPIISVDVVLRQETAAAFGVEDPNGPDGRMSRLQWLPKSLVEIERKPGPSNAATLTCPEWLAKEKGLI